MPSTGWTESPFLLDANTINRVVTKKSAGAYALGQEIQGTFYVHYVGRSDSDLAARLVKHVGKYSHFKAGYYDTAKAAFEKECRLYHDFTPRDNQIHPDRPQNSYWECPVCTIFD